jgi:hypothetical protein
MKSSKGIGIVLFMIMVQSVNAQVVIRENITINSEESAPILVAGSHNSGLGEINQAAFIAEKSGDLKFYVDYAARYLSEIPSDAYFEIRIQGSMDTTYTIPVSYFLKNRLVTPTNDFCSGNWFLYGQGSHSFSTGYNGDFQDSYTSNERRPDFNFDNQNFDGINTIEVQTSNEDNYVLQKRSFMKFRLPTVVYNSIDTRRGFNRLSLQLAEFRLAEEDFFEVSLIGGNWSAQSITRNNEPFVLDDLKKKIFGKDRSVPVVDQPGYYFLNIENFTKYWLSGNSNYGISFELPNPDNNFLKFFSTEQGRFGAPRFELSFEYPAGEPTNPPIFLTDISVGDTVLVAYLSNGQPFERGRVLSERNVIVRDTLTRGRPFQFWETRTAPSLCGRTGYIVDQATGVLMVEEEVEDLELVLEIPGTKEVWPTIPTT